MIHYQLITDIDYYCVLFIFYDWFGIENISIKGDSKLIFCIWILCESIH